MLSIAVTLSLVKRLAFDADGRMLNVTREKSRVSKHKL